MVKRIAMQKCKIAKMLNAKMQSPVFISTLFTNYLSRTTIAQL